MLFYHYGDFFDLSGLSTEGLIRNATEDVTIITLQYALGVERGSSGKLS
jgi:hypothetical protein